MSKIGHFCLKLDYSVRLLARSASNLRLIFQGMESIATSRRRRRSRFLKKKKEITVTKAYLTKRERGKKKYKEMMKKEKLTNYRVEVQELKYGENTQNS